MLKHLGDDQRLKSIRIVTTDHLVERVKLDFPKNRAEFSEESDLDIGSPQIIGQDLNEKPDLLTLDSYGTFRHKKQEVTVKTDSDELYNNMNNNLMFRSMFFMNDETRHFLAPPLPLTPTDSEYFQRKVTTNNPNAAATPSNVATSVSVSTSDNSTNTDSTLGAPTPNSTPNHISVQSATAVQHQQQQQQQTIVTNSIDTKTVLIAHAPKARPHACGDCGKAFMLKHHLLTHMRVHTGERPHVCPECGKTFALKHCLSTHLLLHTADRPFKCMECNKTFTLKHHLVSHERVHTRDRPFECTECGRKFPQKRHLTTHIKFHSGERPYSCQICGENFSREEHLVMHSRFHGGLSPYVCPDCGAGFLRKFELVNHERQHGRNPESCPTCGKEFLQKRTLLMHMRTCGLRITQTPQTQQFETPQLNKTCRECGESFATSEGLALHLRLHVGDHSFLTDICSLAATLKQSVPVTNNIAQQNTTAMHVNKKSHVCEDCGRCFTQRHGLYQHRARHPEGTCKLKPFACEKCGKAFSQKNHLSLHERQHMDPAVRNQSQQQRQAQQQAQVRQQAQQQVRQQAQQQVQQQQAAQQQQQATQQQHAQQQAAQHAHSAMNHTSDQMIAQQQGPTGATDPSPEILRHLHMSSQQLQPARIMQHMQPGTAQILTMQRHAAGNQQ